MKSYKKELFDKHDLFDLEDNAKNKILIRGKILEIIDGINKPDAQDYHILGLLFYDTSESLNEIDIAHRYFKKSLEEDNEYYMARLYSAHCYHDKKDYKNALNEYLLVNEDKLQKEFAIWRYIKLQEQIGCCYYNLGNLNESNIYFTRLLELYRSNEFSDLVDPLEIYECLSKSDLIYKELKKIEAEYYGS